VIVAFSDMVDIVKKYWLILLWKHVVIEDKQKKEVDVDQDCKD